MSFVLTSFDISKLMMVCGMISGIEENSKEPPTKRQLKEVEEILTILLNKLNHGKEI